MGGRTPRAHESANQAHEHNDKELRPREEEEQWNLCKDDLLEHHGKSNNSSNHNSQQATSHHQNECLIKVKKFDAVSRESHCSQDSNLFGLIKQVCGHTRCQREQTKDHSDNDDHMEDDV